MTGVDGFTLDYRCQPSREKLRKKKLKEFSMAAAAALSGFVVGPTIGLVTTGFVCVGVAMKCRSPYDYDLIMPIRFNKESAWLILGVIAFSVAVGSFLDHERVNSKVHEIIPRAKKEIAMGADQVYYEGKGSYFLPYVWGSNEKKSIVQMNVMKREGNCATILITTSDKVSEERICGFPEGYDKAVKIEVPAPK